MKTYNALLCLVQTVLQHIEALLSQIVLRFQQRLLHGLSQYVVIRFQRFKHLRSNTELAGVFLRIQIQMYIDLFHSLIHIIYDGFGLFECFVITHVTHATLTPPLLHYGRTIQLLQYSSRTLICRR